MRMTQEKEINTGNTQANVNQDLVAKKGTGTFPNKQGPSLES